jgi:multidrug efflux pump subunit AcrA (membrane-fusion protein)
MKKRVFCSLLALVLFLLSSCLPTEEAVLPAPTLTIPIPTFYVTDSVVVEDVVYYQSLRARPVPTHEEIIHFPMNGILIYRAHVRVGDFVEEGDIVMELDRTSYLRELEEAINDVERARLSLRQLDELHGINIQRAALFERPVDQAGYIRRRDNYNHQIDVLTIRVDSLEVELERRLLRATMNGYVAFIREFIPGDLTVANQRAAEITYGTEALFLVSDEGANLLSAGDVVEIYVMRDTHVGVVVEPHDYDITADRGDYEAFIMIQGGQQYRFSGGTTGRIHVVFDTAQNVLAVPTGSVNFHGDRAFVFVLDDGLRVLRDIQVGLVGNSLTEVVSGLEEGELVIR